MELVVGGYYVWCLVIVVIFMGFRGAEVGKALKSSFGVAMLAIRRDNFYGKKRRSHFVILLC